LHTYHSVLKQPRRHGLRHSYLGPEFSESRIQSGLKNAGLECRKLDRHDLLEQTAEQIAAGKVVGWFQGRMEWGPRALGNRSIVADPRRADMRDIINMRIKFRERFRPFAPSVLEEALDDYFVGGVPDPFMLQVYPVRPDKRAVVPAITHVDGSGRLQTVSRRSNPRYYALIKAFER